MASRSLSPARDREAGGVQRELERGNLGPREASSPKLHQGAAGSEEPGEGRGCAERELGGGPPRSRAQGLNT